MGPGPGDLRWVDAARLEAVRLESEGLLRKCAQSRAHARATRDQIRRRRSQREMPAGRQAGSGCIPVVEQAKGIVMAQQGCRPEQAFDLLHRASQRANVRIFVLAAQVVEYFGTSENVSNVTPISLGAIRCLR